MVKNNYRLILLSLLFCFVGCFASQGQGQLPEISQEQIDENALLNAGLAEIPEVENPDPNQRYGDNNVTWLMFVVNRPEGHQQVLQALNNPNVQVNLQDNLGNTALMYAVSYDNNQESVQALLGAQGINIDLADNNGKTPLMHAAQQSRLGCVKLLLAAGADLSLSDNDNNWTALDYAAKFGNYRVNNYLVWRALRLNPRLITAQARKRFIISSGMFILLSGQLLYMFLRSEKMGAVMQTVAQKFSSSISKIFTRFCQPTQ